MAYARNSSSNSAAVDPQAENGEGEKKGPSKSELKKMAKEAEKEKKRIEREAKEAAAKAAREAADVVSFSKVMLCRAAAPTCDSVSLTLDCVPVGLRYPKLWPTTTTSITGETR